MTTHKAKYTPEQQALAERIIGLERVALDKWFKGDTSSYRNLWSKKSFSYFDIANPERVDSYQTIDQFLDQIEGQLFAKSYEFQHPRVQLGKIRQY